MKCLLISSDLMFGTQAAQAVCDAGYDVKTSSNAVDAMGLTAESLGGVRLVLADLTMPQFDAQQVADQLRAAIDPPPRLIAVGPHVQRAKLEAARAAGWQVWTRGQFHASAASLLGPLASTQ
jgi:CheY-like chemotaxis protein